MMDELKAQLWAREIQRMKGLNVFENTRQRDVVTYRALHVYMCKEILKWSLHKIKDFYINNGKKSYDHATVLHALNMFDIYCKYDSGIMDLFSLISGSDVHPTVKLATLKAKLNFIDELFYEDVQFCLIDAYNKTIALNEQKIKEDQKRKKEERLYAL